MPALRYPFTQERVWGIMQDKRDGLVSAGPKTEFSEREVLWLKVKDNASLA
jgi:hypothetical protein